ncbi:MAG: hypothetical protein RLZZ480_918 [Candidatus Parcubacteria bacterium]|jgi:hypothetical protein
MTTVHSFFTKSLLMVVFSALLLMAVPAFAKEITSGGGGGGVTTTCNPVSSLTYKGDARVGETGLAGIKVSYTVKPCIKNQAVRVGVEVYESATGLRIYEDTDALLSNTFDVFGVKVRTSYTVKVTVYDRLTGEVVGTRSIFAAAIPKGV